MISRLFHEEFNKMPFVGIIRFSVVFGIVVSYFVEDIINDRYIFDIDNVEIVRCLLQIPMSY